MTGFWTGTYWYFRHGEPVVPFLANIDDSDGTISGTTSEPDYLVDSGIRLTAFLIGGREGARVKFAKVYDGKSSIAHRGDYTGALSDDGKVLKGSWYLTGEWGGFKMSRQILKEESSVEDLVEVPVGLGAEPQ